MTIQDMGGRRLLVVRLITDMDAITSVKEAPRTGWRLAKWDSDGDEVVPKVQKTTKKLAGFD
jgi:hypothetical protein